jgi:hypothetical protein
MENDIQIRNNGIGTGQRKTVQPTKRLKPKIRRRKLRSGAHIQEV